jgi:RNA polymerase sigma factor (sigma-70 family)
VNDGQAIGRSLVDAEAFALLFDRHFRSLHRYLWTRVGRSLADDLASEVFEVAFRRRAAFDCSRGDARPWLYGIATNLMREHRRSEERWVRDAYALRVDDPVRSDGDSIDGRLAGALLMLEPEEPDLLLLFAWVELSYAELAEAFALPIGTVRSRLNRARRKLRAHLSEAVVT